MRHHQFMDHLQETRKLVMLNNHILADAIPEERLNRASLNRERFGAFRQHRHPKPSPRASGLARSGSRLAILGAVLAILALFTVPAGAQTSQATVNVNSFTCPADYDEHSDCLKVGGVVVSVVADGQVVGEPVTVVEGSADVAVLPGAAVTVSVVGGTPADTTLEPANLSFDAVDGANPVTLVFLTAAQGEPVDTDQDGLSDEEEAGIGSDPNSYDTDGDGVGDGGEVNADTDPLVVDTDGDGFTDREELDVQTDPLDPSSFPVPTETNSIAITAYTCPAGYEGKDLFTDCVTPEAGVDFTVSLNASEFGVTQTTTAAGQVAVTNLGPGEYTVREDLGDLDGELQRYTAFCFGDAPAGAPEPRQIVYTDLGDGAYGLELTEGEEITCTWYNIPAADAEPTAPPKETPAPPKPGKRGPVTALPNTGAGAGPDDKAGLYALAGTALVLLTAGLAEMARRRT